MDELNLAMFAGYEVLSVVRVTSETWEQSLDKTELVKSYTDVTLSVVFISEEPLYLLMQQPFLPFGFSVERQRGAFRDMSGRKRVEVEMRMVARH